LKNRLGIYWTVIYVVMGLFSKKLLLSAKTTRVKALGLVQAFEESADWALVS